MNRRHFFLGLSGLAGCTSGRPQRLNVYNWSSYVAPDTVSNFEKEFGVRVRYAIYESNEELLAKVMTGNCGWDLIFPTNPLILPLRENDLLAPLQHRWLSNLGHLEPRFRNPSWDPDLTWCVPYLWGSTGITYNRKVTPPPMAWADLWRDNLRGRITMLDDPAEVIGACLKKLGYSLNSIDPAQLARARQEAVSQKSLVRAYLNAEVRDQLVAGDVLASQLWATTSQQAMDATAHLAFVYPQEGFALWADNATVLRESRRQELAHRFINYLLRPEVAASIVRATRTATPNQSARNLLPPEERQNPVLYPPESTLNRGEWLAPLPAPAQRLRDRIWTEIKAS